MSLYAPPRPTISRIDQIMAYNLKKDLVGAWPLDEASGTRRDHSGLGNDLTDNATVTGAAGPSINIPLASQFTAANLEFLSIANNPNNNIGDIDFAIWAWCYFDSLGDFYRPICSKRGTNQNVCGLFYSKSTDSGFFEFEIYSLDILTINEVEASTFGAPSTNTWYFIAAWHDSVANTLNIQINNGAINSAATTIAPTTGTAPLRIGFDADVAYMNGRISELNLIKRIPTAQEWTWLYNRGSGRSQSERRLAA